jgi:hypothetical protein
MIEALNVILIVGLVLFLVYFIAGKFVQGTPLNIIGAILALIFVLYALQRVGLFGSLRF